MERSLIDTNVEDGDWLDFIDDSYNDEEVDEGWETQYERRCEQEMLDSMDVVNDVIALETLLDRDDLDYDWDGFNDEIEMPFLVKSASRRTRPSKRQLHQVDSDCIRLRDRRSTKRFTLKQTRRRQRRADRAEVSAQLCPSPLYATSVADGLPADVTPEYHWLGRNFTVNFREDGTVVYTYDVEVVPVILRRDNRFRLPRHLYYCHPAATSVVRRNGR